MPLPRVRDNEGLVGDDLQFTQFDEGLLTDVAPLDSPPGSTKDEANFDLLQDGTRRRRKGIKLEAGGSILVDPLGGADTPSSNTSFNWHRWNAVNEDASVTFIVMKLGSFIHFYTEADVMSTSRLVGSIQLAIYSARSSGVAGTTSVAVPHVSMTSGQGKLFITGKYLQPLIITYIPATLDFDVQVNELKYRDFVGNKDSIELGDQPNTIAPPTVNPDVTNGSHSYNLKNRGWPTRWIDAYKAGLRADGTISAGLARNRMPAKTMAPWAGVLRYKPGFAAGVTDTNPDDWLKMFDSDKLDEENFGTSSAAQGRFVLDAFDTRQAYVGNTGGLVVNSFPITSLTCTINAPFNWMGDVNLPRTKLTLQMVIETDTFSGWAHAPPYDKFFINNLNYRLYTTAAGPAGTYTNFTKFWYEEGTLRIVPLADPVWTAAAGPTTFSFEVVVLGKMNNNNPASFVIEPGTNMTVADKIGETNPEGDLINVRPTVNTFWQGRIFYAGVEHRTLSDSIMFSKLVTPDADVLKDYAQMYQENDPTDQFRNGLLPTDGGVIEIPGLGGVNGLVPLQNSLVILSENGIWELSGAGRNPFSATSISVRKIAEVEVTGPTAYVNGETGLFVASARGAFLVAPDTNSGYLRAISITFGKIQKFWSTLYAYNFKYAQAAYDVDNHKLIILLRRITDLTGDLQALEYSYDTILYYDAVLEAWTVETIPGALDINDLPALNGILHGIFVLDKVSRDKKIRYVIADSDVLSMFIADKADVTNYSDWGNPIEQAFLETSYVVGTDLARHKAAPVFTSFMKKTETGYAPVTLDPINTSSLKMQAKWDFTDKAQAGKWSQPQELYRPRAFLPSGTTDLSGYDIVTNRTKLRGRGRGLSLKLDAGTTATDAHLIGFTINPQYERVP